MSDDDFINPEHPEWGYVPAIAQEKFSDLVNRVPIDLNDGVNIILSGDHTIESLYFYQMLNPSLAYVPPGSSDAVAASIMAAFGRVKDDAMKLWEQVRLEKIKLMLDYMPAVPTPAAWYDSHKNDVWTQYSLNITESTAPGPAPPIFRLKLSDAAMTTLLEVHPETKALPVNMPARVLTKVSARPAMMMASPALAASPRILAAQPIGARLAVPPFAVAAGPAVNNAVLHAQFETQVRTLKVTDRLMVAQYVGSVAPTAPATTKSISVSFEYCKTDIQRPWYADGFVNDKSWFVPNVRKGAVSADSGGMALLPIGFVAIRNLVISANWTREDVESANGASGFGPFKVAFDTTRQSLVHPGMQIFGWMLQKVQQLPPNDPQ